MARVLISADMEGVAGITHLKQVLRDSSEFAEACRLMTAEVVAACEGAAAGGASSILVNDSHADMRNIDPEALPQGVRLIRGNVKPWSMSQGVEGCDAIAFLGYHAPAATTAGILDHTYSSATVHEVSLNGETLSEARLNAAVAGSFGVPAIFLSGDQSACADAERFLPWVRRVEVKHAIGRAAAVCLSPQDARAAIARTMQEAVAALAHDAFEPYVIEPPLVLEVSFMKSEMADVAEILPEATRVAGTRVRVVHDDIRSIFRYFRVLMLLGAAVA
jgi:D-amino peptidase